MPRDIMPKPKPMVPVETVQSLLCKPSVITSEIDAYVRGVFATFRENVAQYQSLNRHEHEIQARLELSEKTLCLTRDHLIDTLKQVEGTVTPKDWQPLLNDVQFVGVRLVDACLTLLRQHGKMSSEELLTALNGGMFRFRTTSPLREIHAAMLRQRKAKKIGNEYVWSGGGAPVKMRPRPAAVATTSDPTDLEVTGTEMK